MTALFGYCKDPNNKRKWIPRISVEHERDHDDDMICIDGWIYIMPMGHEEEFQRLGQEKQKRTVPGWYMTYAVYDPGVRYHKDGSGTPPSTDVVDCDPPTVRHLYKAIEQVCGMIVKNIVSNLAESASFEAMLAEESI